MEQARLSGFADGGFVGSDFTQSVSATSVGAEQIGNDISNLPSPVVSVVDIERTQKRVKVKQDFWQRSLG